MARVRPETGGHLETGETISQQRSISNPFKINPLVSLMTFHRISTLALMLILSIAQVPAAQSAGKTVQKSAAPDPSYVWQYFTFEDPQAGNSETVQLVFAIPETDAIEGAVTCNALAKGNARLDLGGNVGHAQNGAKVKAIVFGKTTAATIIIPESGEGLVGVSVPLKTGDAIFGKLASQSSLVYSLTGDGERKIPLSAAKGLIKKFIRACNEFATKK